MAILSKVKLMLQNILEQFSQISTDKGLLQYDGEELVEGAVVYVIDEEGNQSKPEDGDYYLGEEDGRTLVVEDGKITEIKETEPEGEQVEVETEDQEEPEEEKKEDEEKEDEEKEDKEDKNKEKFNKIKAVFEESYQEKEQKIIGAIRAKGFDCWLVEAGDDYAVVECWIDETASYVYYKFPISWDENGEAVAGDGEEVKSAFVPVKEEQPVVEETFSKEEKESLENEISELKARIAELEEKPSEKPANVRFKNQVMKTDDEKLNNLLRYCK